jgi:hypothetical protein
MISRATPFATEVRSPAVSWRGAVWPVALRGEPDHYFSELIWRLNLKFFEYAFPLRGNAVYGFAKLPGDTFVCSALGEPP